ncbi:hypothetical protein PG991_005295 [Apiospora marii]|uniref:Uncharacterized protein n=1 Tax=Apiospora marii TaxID=335849 RepID=A0ABR1S8S2_9PEZI
MQTRNILLLPVLSGLAAAQSSASDAAVSPSSSAAAVDGSSSSSSMMMTSDVTVTTAAPSMTGSMSGSGMMTGGAASASWVYYNTTVVTTAVVAQLTTVCQGPATTLTFNGCAYPVTQGQTLTVTNCPCTITTAVPTMTSSLCTGGAAPTGAMGSSGPMNGDSSSSPTGGAAVPPGMNNASPDMPMGGSSMMATPSSPTASPSTVMVAGAPGAQTKNLAGLAAAVVGVLVLGSL